MLEHVVERVLDLLRSHGLEQDFAECSGIRCSREVPGGEHHPNIRLQLSRMYRQFNAVEIGHDDVSEKHINVLTHENPHRFWRASGHEDSEARVFQYFCHWIAD